MFLRCSTFAEYADRLMRVLVARYLESPAVLRASIDEIRQNQPEPLAAEYDHPVKAAAVARHIARFNHM